MTYSSGSVLSVERHNYQTLPCGYGSDTGGCTTDKILEYVVSRFGPVASFSGSYRADSWTLNMYRRNTPGILCIIIELQSYHNDYTGCPNMTTLTSATTTVMTTVSTPTELVTTSGSDGTCTYII